MLMKIFSPKKLKKNIINRRVVIVVSDYLLHVMECYVSIKCIGNILLQSPSQQIFVVDNEI